MSLSRIELAEVTRRGAGSRTRLAAGPAVQWARVTSDTTTTPELIAALEAGLQARISSLDRRASVYRSSFAIEDLRVRFADGGELDLLFKDLSPNGLSQDAKGCKPPFLYDPLREIYVYERLLGPEGITAPKCYASVVDEAAQRYWIFLEKLRGVELYQVGPIETWEHAARWLARLHARFAPRAQALAADGRLLLHDRAFYRQWIERANEFTSGRLARVAEGYDRVIDRLTDQPRTLLHGEFYASNVLVEVRADGPAVRPVDWEMSALGPGGIDLAALTAGKWSEPQRRQLVRAYADELRAANPEAARAVEESIDHARLHLAVQWLGWSQQWSPPPQHAHDWLNEALQLAEKLGL